MARRRPATKRVISPDPTYGSTELEKFTNRLMRGGKKSIARRAVYDAIRIVEKELERPESSKEVEKSSCGTIPPRTPN